jgi:hypothetical protein
VIRLLDVATIKEFNAYRGTSPVAKTDLKFWRLNLLGSKFGGKTNKLRGG